MNVFGKRLAELRKKHGLSQYEFAEKLGFSRGQVGNYEQGRREPDYETLNKIADFFSVSIDYLLGRDQTQTTLPELTEKDERDIQKELENLIAGLKSKNGFAAFGGQDISELDEEDRELLIVSLENSLRIAKRIAKQKFTPKKHRKN